MAKANISRRALIEAIVSLESHRNPTGDDPDLERAVRVALPALREKLADLQSRPDTEQAPHLAVLVADLSGFTALSERMDAERVHDALNAMWQVLDEVILAWGGRIDQHAGDSLLALFGLPHPRGNESARALQAALAMQTELQLFNQRVQSARLADLEPSWMQDWTSPQMRIGVHAGPVYFVQTPGSSHKTAVGDTILIGRHLEKQAPAGQVLSSATVYRQTSPRFRMEPVSTAGVTFTSPVTGRLVGEEAFLVMDERPETRYIQGVLAGKQTRLVGRSTEMDELQLALQMAIDSRRPQLVTLAGGPGAGKSRLIFEFESQARLFDESLTILHAGGRQPWVAPAYSLIRDLLLRRLSIRPQHSRYLIENKLRQAIARIQPDEPKRPIDSTVHDEVIGLLLQLLDIHSAATLDERDVFATVIHLIASITSSGPAILILNQVHGADRQSLELIDQLLLVERDLPVLIVCVVESEGSDDLALIPWLGRDEDPFSPSIRLDIQPLTPVEGRLMATDLLSDLSPLPMRLIDLVVAESRGNPLYIADFTRSLLERGELIPGDPWRVDLARVESMQLPVALRDMVCTRLNNLPEDERKVLQYASVMGHVFWDGALLAPGEPVDETFSDTDVAVALLRLVEKKYLVEDATVSFTGIRAFSFLRPVVREVAYDSLPEAARQRFHRQIADWLITVHEETQSATWLPIDVMIVWHLGRAGESDRAAAWQQRHDHAGRKADRVMI